METDRTDLLPLERRHKLHRAYLFRLATVSALFGAALFFIATGLLLPTRLLLGREVKARQTQLMTVGATLSSTADAALSQQLASFKSDVATLATLQDTPMATTVMTEVLAVARPGVVLTGFMYTPAQSKRAGSLSITGIASNRAALQAYQAALQAAPFATSADLPVSAYARAANIAFTITVILAS